jgi:hypothetical protein
MRARASEVTSLRDRLCPTAVAVSTVAGVDVATASLARGDRTLGRFVEQA